MIIKIFKIIHNHYSRFFRFIFFLRYLVGIFFISSILFLVIPTFFNYEKRVKVLNNYLLKTYNFKISQYEKVEFKAFPLPKLIFKNININLNSSSIEMKVKNLKIYPKLLNIYNYENYRSNKIILKDSYGELKLNDSKMFIKYLLGQKNRFFFDNLNININDLDNSVISIKNINFSNFGYKKNLVSGKAFSKNFKIKFNDNIDSINFKFLKTGIDTDIYLKDKKKSFISGVIKSKILKTNVKFNFDYNKKSLNINNLYLRNKNLSLNSEVIILLDPFLDVRSKFQIEDINSKVFNNLNLDKLLEAKDKFKQFNGTNDISFKSKKFNRSFINELNLIIDLAYGRLNFNKMTLIGKNLFQCKGSVNLLEEYPILFFNCIIISDDKKEFLAKFNIKSKKKNENFKLNFTGNINVLNKKINFTKIFMNQNYEASAEDLKYFKTTYEKIVFDRNFVEMFNIEKIKKFILEIS